MPSFDVVSQINMHELANAIDQSNREVSNRFDFKGTNSRVEHEGDTITLTAPSEFQINQINDILRTKMSKRGIDVGCLDYGDIQETGQEARQQIVARQGIDKELARKITKIIKDTKLKVQSAVQGDQIRVTGKKRDDLQAVIAVIKEQKLTLPLQYINFRD
jgi:hypothetical protein